MTYYLNNNTYRSVFFKARESTASSPSGMHYGQYIAALDNNILTEVNTIFVNVPFFHGFSLERWKRSTHCMLQKKPKPYLNKLRIIQLVESDFNSALTYILSHRLLHHSEYQAINTLNI